MLNENTFSYSTSLTKPGIQYDSGLHFVFRITFILCTFASVEKSCPYICHLIKCVSLENGMLTFNSHTFLQFLNNVYLHIHGLDFSSLHLFSPEEACSSSLKLSGVALPWAGKMSNNNNNTTWRRNQFTKQYPRKFYTYRLMPSAFTFIEREWHFLVVMAGSNPRCCMPKAGRLDTGYGTLEVGTATFSFGSSAG